VELNLFATCSIDVHIVKKLLVRIYVIGGMLRKAGIKGVLSFIGSLMVDEERIRPDHWSESLACSLQCFVS